MGYLVGLDIGSTTLKTVVIDEYGKTVFSNYERHFSKVREKTAELLKEIKGVLGNRTCKIAVTGSAGLGVAKAYGLDFVQEVFATAGAVAKFLPDIDLVIELGGEDAKILFFKGTLEERMNGSCAGGTGAFVDQMAVLLGVTPAELNELSKSHEKIYSIASRCGVFAKSDIQPLLNQGARKEDIAASIFQCVVDQTIAGLAQGRKLEGKIAFLGGPLFFYSGLRERFIKTLKLSEENAVLPEDAIYFIAKGAAIYAEKQKDTDFDALLNRISEHKGNNEAIHSLEPLFGSNEEYNAFVERHAKTNVKEANSATYTGDAYLGIDAGSTTTKIALITPNGELLHTYYTSNLGNPLNIVKEELLKIYEFFGDRITIKGSAVTGYGEDLLKNAFSADYGLVETIAHYQAAKFFNPNVDFIIDIGGQDIKCFKIRNGTVDSIMLNEACSSGCGSFIETFAKALGYSAIEFAKLGVFAKHPVDLGSRCTVFMNSSVKQAQKDGAGVDDISAGLSISVVKNAIYKVIRASNPTDLGKNIVVQGGTFLNDAVLRSFEKELDLEVTRPVIAGIMGAFGAALAAKDLALEKSALLTLEELKTFTHTSKATNCGLCTNRCHLIVNTFNDNKKYISGNRCERPVKGGEKHNIPNLQSYKYEKLMSYQSTKGQRGKIGIALGLNLYETLPFWHTFLSELGFEIVLSEKSSRALFIKGQFTIPSDTVCYPAKLMHGHIESLLEQGIDTIFYPCMPYNIDESKGDNHYNCPVVAYYPELLDANVKDLKKIKFLRPYFGLHNRKGFVKKAAAIFGEEYGITQNEVKDASKKAYKAYEDFLGDIQKEGEKALRYAKENNLKTIILAGRPYHIDPEINHGIDELITSLNLVLITEDAVAHLVPKQKVSVLNQWTYHSRLYNAAKFVTTQENMELVQLVSFGCGLDAITTDETRDILEHGNKLYVQLKIDEISNHGAIKIRLRSLIAAMDARK